MITRQKKTRSSGIAVVTRGVAPDALSAFICDRRSPKNARACRIGSCHTRKAVAVAL